MQKISKNMFSSCRLHLTLHTHTAAVSVIFVEHLEILYHRLCPNIVSVPIYTYKFLFQGYNGNNYIAAQGV